MKRRDLVVGLSAVGILAGAVPGRAQRPRRVGYLSPEPPGAAAGQTETALRQGLRDLGWIDGQNLTIVIRQAETPERMVAAAAELARLDVDLIVSAGSIATAAAKAATSTIPVVFGSAPDPVRRGFVESLARPGGNLTGLAILDEIVPKLLEIVHRAAGAPRRLSLRAGNHARAAAQPAHHGARERGSPARDGVSGAADPRGRGHPGRDHACGLRRRRQPAAGDLRPAADAARRRRARRRAADCRRRRPRPQLRPLPELSCPMASRFRTCFDAPPALSTRCSKGQSRAT